MTGAADDGKFDWDLLMRFGLGALGLAPRDFWSMTPVEFEAAAKGAAGELGARPKLSRSEFERLIARFPDESDEARR